MDISSKSRRKFIGKSATATAGIMLAAQTGFGFPNIIRNYGKNASAFKGVQIGTITYSFRSMADQSAEATLQYVLDCGVSHIELMGDPAESFAGKPKSTINRREQFRLFRLARSNEELTDEQKKEIAEAREQMETYNKEVSEWRASVSMDKFEEVKKMYAAKGVQIYCWKPNAFGKNNTDAEINYGFRAAKAMGASHVTLEHPSDDAHTMKLGNMAANQKMSVAYHGHEQQTPTLWDTALEQSKNNAMNLDLGHYIAAGNTDAIELIKAKHQRIMSMHVKDRKNPENGKANMPWGLGDTPITEVLQLMRDEKYSFPATVEMEYEIPEGSDAVKEVKKCVEYCQTALDS